MNTKQEIDLFLNKNVSYLFTLSIWKTAFHPNSILNKYIIDTYLYYNNSNKYINVLLRKECLNDLNYCLNNTGKNNNSKIPGYQKHAEVGEIILVQLDRKLYLNDTELLIIENSNYELLKGTNIDKKAFSLKSATGLDLHRKIIYENQELKEILESKLDTKVNAYWTKFDMERETLTDQRIELLGKKITLDGAWLLKKLDNADQFSKIIYKEIIEKVSNEKLDVLNPRHEITLEPKKEIEKYEYTNINWIPLLLENIKLVENGSLIKHKKFGVGKVENMNQASKIATIKFSESGTKQIMLNYALQMIEFQK